MEAFCVYTDQNGLVENLKFIKFLCESNHSSPDNGRCFIDSLVLSSVSKTKIENIVLLQAHKMSFGLFEQLQQFSRMPVDLEVFIGDL